MYQLLFNITQKSTSKLLKIYISNEKFNHLKLDMNFNLVNYIDKLHNNNISYNYKHKKQKKKKHYRKFKLRKHILKNTVFPTGI